MEQGMIDWTAFSTDEPWLLPEPLPAAIKLPNPLTTNVQTGLSQENLTQCPKHPETSEDCCWRRVLNDPFVGFEEQVASLGHFGVGFPDGYLPETVEGSFTGTHLEYGNSYSVLDASILDRVSSQGSDDGCSLYSTGVKATHDDEGQSEQSPVATDAVELTPEDQSEPSFAMGDIDRDAMATLMSSEEHTMSSESIPDTETARPEAVTANDCPTATTSDRCTMYQENAVHGFAEKFLAMDYENGDDDWAGSPVKVARAPRKYQRKQRLENFDKITPSFRAEQDESDSDYTPDRRKKKRAKTVPTSAYKTPPATAKKIQRRKGKQMWYAKNSSPVTKSRINTKRPTPRAREAGGPAPANYAPVANTARFAVIATRARYAVEATAIRPQPGAQYEDPEDAQKKFSTLQEEFARVKQLARGTGRNVQQVAFADKAGDAIFARSATAAEMVIKFG